MIEPWSPYGLPTINHNPQTTNGQSLGPQTSLILGIERPFIGSCIRQDDEAICILVGLHDGVDIGMPFYNYL